MYLFFGMKKSVKVDAEAIKKQKAAKAKALQNNEIVKK
jgi:hypothetical protein